VEVDQLKFLTEGTAHVLYQLGMGVTVTPVHAAQTWFSSLVNRVGFEFECSRVCRHQQVRRVDMNSRFYKIRKMRSIWPHLVSNR